MTSLRILQAVLDLLPPGPGVPSPCERCDYRQPYMRDGGWCYMFKERVEKDCAQFRPLPVEAKS